MGRLILRIAGILIILFSISNIAFIIDYRMDRTSSIGTPTDLVKEEVPIDKIEGYKITYNLNDGVLNEKNPTSYGMFTETFTLNNPTKEGYKFIGWTGSNGAVPKLTIKIGKGSEGDLEFIANYEAKTFIILENEVLKWQIANSDSIYEIYVNNELAKITINKQINISELYEHFKSGDNSIYVKSGGVKTLNETYYYYNTEDFNNLELNCTFELLSDRYTVHYMNEGVLTPEIKLGFDFKGNLIYKYLKQGYAKPDDVSYEDFLLRIIGPNIKDYEIKLQGITLFEILKEAHKNYSENKQFFIYDLSKNIKFIFGDTNSTEYYPDSIKLKIYYGEIYNDILLYENADIDLSKTKSKNSMLVCYTPNNSQGYNFSSTIKLYVSDNEYWNIKYSLNTFNNEYKTTYSRIQTTESSSSTNYKDITDLLNVKFYLNKDHSFMFKSEIEIIKFLKDLTLNAIEQRTAYELEKGNLNEDGTTIWTKGEKEYIFNVSTYFNVENENNIIVDYSLNLLMTFMTTCNTLLVYK